MKNRRVDNIKETFGPRWLFYVITGILMFGLTGPLLARIFYLAPNGSDQANGSLQNPWQTIMHAVENTAPGDTMMFRGGTYTKWEEIWISNILGHGGTENAWRTMMAYPNEEPTIIHRFLLDANYYRIIGLHWRQIGLGVVEWDSKTHHVELLNNVLTGPFNVYSGAISIQGSNILVEGNRLELADTGSTNDHGIYVLGGSNNIVRKNYVSGAPAYGIHAFDEDKYQDTPKITNLLIEENVVVGARYRSGIMVSIQESLNEAMEVNGVIVRRNIVVNSAQGGIALDFGKLRNISIVHNVCYGNDSGIDLFSDNMSGIKIFNNILSNNRIQVNKASGFSAYELSHNMYSAPETIGSGASDAKAIYGDPKFTNPGAMDFRVQVGSPAIDAGMDVGWSYQGVAPDIGAYESDDIATGINTTIPGQFNLQQSYPNPFNPETRISYELAESAYVNIVVFDLRGAQVITLVDEQIPAGYYDVVWDGKNSSGSTIASGVYFYSMKAVPASNDQIYWDTKKTTLLR